MTPPTLETGAASPAIRLVSWNIQHGGGQRGAAIGRVLAELQPDICGLVEYRSSLGSRRVRDHLAAQGLTHQVTSLPEDAPHTLNALLLASRWPLTLLTAPPEVPPARWLSACVAAPQPLLITAVHVPNRGGPQETQAKYAFLDATVSHARHTADAPAIILGDFNTGRRGIDETGPFFNATEDRFMTTMGNLGWADAFRAVHGAHRAYSWWLRRGENVSGFRLDHAFLSPALMPHLQRCDLVRAAEGWPSDHAALVVDLARPGSDIQAR